jgi:hypothetical protein
MSLGCHISYRDVPTNVLVLLNLVCTTLANTVAIIPVQAILSIGNFYFRRFARFLHNLPICFVHFDETAVSGFSSALVSPETSAV